MGRIGAKRLAKFKNCFLRCKSQSSSQGAKNFNSCVVAQRLECVELAPAFDDLRRAIAGASSMDSKRCARFGCGVAALMLLLYAPLLPYGLLPNSGFQLLSAFKFRPSNFTIGWLSTATPRRWTGR